MTINRQLARDLVAVPLAIGAITSAILWLAAPSRRPLALPPRPTTVAVTSHSPEQLGAQLYEGKGCVACHSVDGTPRVGPTFLHDYGSHVTLDDGHIIAMDDGYIRESLASPRAKARPGFPPSMPSYDGLLSRKEETALIAYLRSLR
jgi:cytochrome c oxidase subunit 2